MASCPLAVSLWARLGWRIGYKRTRVPRLMMFSTDSSSLHDPDERQRQGSNNNTLSQVVDVTDLAQSMRSLVREYTIQNQPIKLVGILAKHHCPYHSHDAELYSQHIAETCQEDHITYELRRIKGDKPQHVEDAIQEANISKDVHGILVYYPIFSNNNDQSSRRGPYKNRLTGVYYKTHDDHLRDLVCPTRDVEGLCHEYNARWLFRARGTRRIMDRDDDSNGEQVLFPCTALSVLRILESYSKNSLDWSGTVVTIVNRSEILGRPLAAMLANEGASVYSFDKDSVLLFRAGGRMRRCVKKTSLKWCLQRSSIVVTGVPSPDFRLPTDHIRPGTTLVNVSEYPNVDEERLLDVPNVLYVPHVGKVTIAILEQNLVQLHRRHHCEQN